MKIGILQTGETPLELRDAHGNYDDFFKRLLAGRGFEFQTYRVLDEEIPPTTTIVDGWIVTGSKYSVLDLHPWIAPLEDFLRQAVEAKSRVLGICFGHQILAQALGGRVERFAGGWEVGAKTYRTVGGTPYRLLAWHQDQVTALPSTARVIAGNPACTNAIVAYGNTALSLQPHPEFTPGFLTELVGARRGILPRKTAEIALGSLECQVPPSQIADRLEAFLKQGQIAF